MGILKRNRSSKKQRAANAGKKLLKARAMLFLLRRIPVIGVLFLVAGVIAKVFKGRKADQPAPGVPLGDNTSAPSGGTSVPPIGSPTATVGSS